MSDKVALLVDDITNTIIKDNKSKLNELNNWFEDVVNNRIPNLENVLEDIKASESDVRYRCEDVSKKYSEVKNEVQTLEKNVKDMRDSYEKKTKELSSAKKERDKLFNQCEKTMKLKTITPLEKKQLEKAKFEFNMYQRLTDVRWDFANQDPKSVRGYVRNKSTCKAKMFNYVSTELTHEEITESLWNDIDAIEDDWLNEAADKENQQNNEL